MGGKRKVPHLSRNSPSDKHDKKQKKESSQISDKTAKDVAKSGHRTQDRYIEGSIEKHTPEKVPNIISEAADFDRILDTAKHGMYSGNGDLQSTLDRNSRTRSNDTKTSLPDLPAILNPQLERAVFTHSSICADDPKSGAFNNYDKLEFLGDAYIELIATKIVWRVFPRLPTGRLSQIRETLVNNESIGKYSVDYGFHEKISIPPEYLQQPKLWAKVKGDIFEAYIGAIILSDPQNGYQRAEKWLTDLWLPTLSSIEPEPLAIHYKQELAKKVMDKGIRLKYIDENPPLQLPMGVCMHFVGAYITGWGWENKHLGSGQGPNKVTAGNNAAKEALQNHPLIDELAAAKLRFDKAKALSNQVNQTSDVKPYRK